MIIDLCDQDDDDFGGTNLPSAPATRNSQVSLPFVMEDTNDDDFIEDIPPISHSQSSQRRKNGKEKLDVKKKAAAKSAALEERRTKQIRDQQSTGYYRHKELSIVMEDNLHRSPMGSEITSTLLFLTEDKNYGVFSAQSTVPGLCRWTYRSYMDGGNGNIRENNVTVLPYVVIIYPPDVFINVVMVGGEGSEFPGLAAEASSIREKLQADEHCPMHVKIVLMVININDECLQYQRRAAEENPSCKRQRTGVSTRVDEAIAYLQYDEDIDVTCRKNSAEVAQFLEATTRVLGEQIYGQETTAAETLRRLPMRALGPDEYLSAHERVQREMEDTWINMLQVIPGVSRTRAETLAGHFPTMQLLIEALNNEAVPVAEREVMLQNKFDPSMNCIKLSKLVYRIFTCRDPSLPLSEE